MPTQVIAPAMPNATVMKPASTAPASILNMSAILILIAMLTKPVSTESAPNTRNVSAQAV
jgi:hypothetical protein